MFQRLRSVFSREGDRPQAQDQEDNEELAVVSEQPGRLLAYQTMPPRGLRLERAPAARDWMDQLDRQFAYRCLPLLVANQAGWIIRNSHHITAHWNGGSRPSDLIISLVDGPADTHMVSHFGYGILTWQLPYLFRTPAKVNLLVRGPANLPKHGACALDGIVETDWAVASFTMNWKLTCPGATVEFAKDEPICMIVPQGRDDLELFEPELRRIETNLPLSAAYKRWRNSRAGPPLRFQRHYLKGMTVLGAQAPEHRVKLKLKEFVDRR